MPESAVRFTSRDRFLLKELSQFITQNSAADVSFDPTGTTLTSTNVQDALVELWGLITTGSVWQTKYANSLDLAGDNAGWNTSAPVKISMSIPSGEFEQFKIIAGSVMLEDISSSDWTWDELAGTATCNRTGKYSISAGFTWSRVGSGDNITLAYGVLKDVAPPALVPKANITDMLGASGEVDSNVTHNVGGGVVLDVTQGEKIALYVSGVNNNNTNTINIDIQRIGFTISPAK